MSLSITYELKDFNTKEIIDKFGMTDGGDADLFLANTCFRRMQKYVPFDTGALSTTATIRPKTITYEMPYAHKQYTGNKGKGIRGKFWDRRMKSAEGAMVAKEVENYVKQKKGNR